MAWNTSCETSTYKKCVWEHNVEVWPLVGGFLDGTVDFRSFRFGEDYKVSAQGDSVVVSLASSCSSETLSFRYGFIVHQDALEPLKRETDCSQQVIYHENTYSIRLNAFEYKRLDLGLIVFSYNGRLSFYRVNLADPTDAAEASQALQKFIADLAVKDAPAPVDEDCLCPKSDETVPPYDIAKILTVPNAYNWMLQPQIFLANLSKQLQTISGMFNASLTGFSYNGIPIPPQNTYPPSPRKRTPQDPSLPPSPPQPPAPRPPLGPNGEPALVSPSTIAVVDMSIWLLSQPQLTYPIYDPTKIAFPLENVDLSDKIIIQIRFTDGSVVQKAYPVNLNDIASVSLKPMRG